MAHVPDGYLVMFAECVELSFVDSHSDLNLHRQKLSNCCYLSSQLTTNNTFSCCDKTST